MRVAHVVRQCHPGRGALETFVLSLAKQQRLAGVNAEALESLSRDVDLGEGMADFREDLDVLLEAAVSEEEEGVDEKVRKEKGELTLTDSFDLLVECGDVAEQAVQGHAQFDV